MNISLGEKNRNPLNVKQGPTPWKGSVGMDARGHAIFDDEAYSVRACVRTLSRKCLNGKTTLEKIMESYAPADDGNNPAEYADFVASRIDVAADDELGLFDDGGRIIARTRLVAMLCAMAEMECGRTYKLPSDVILVGIDLYEKDFIGV